MTERETLSLATFQQRYAKRSWNPRIPYQPHEFEKLDASHGLRALQPAPAQSVCFGRPRVSIEDPGKHTYLWVIDDLGIPYIIDRPFLHLNGAHPKHTNITGGADAYLGGEIWFKDSITLFLSGSSGRYPPMHETQLNDAVQVFESYGYRIMSLGWNFGNGQAERIYRVT